MTDVESPTTETGTKIGFCRQALHRPLWAWLTIIAVAVTPVIGISFARWVQPDELSLFRRGLVACDEGRIAEANSLAAELARRDAGNWFGIVVRGAIRLREGKWSDALRQFSSVRPEGEIREPLLRLTGECLYRLGRLHEAAHVMQELADEHPGDAESHRWLGAIFYDLGLRVQAIEELHTAARLVPTDPRPHRLLGLIYYDNKLQYAESVHHLQQALELADSGGQHEVVAELGHCLIELRQYERAVLLLANVAEQPDLIALRAEALWNLGRSSESERDLGTVLRVAPENPRANLLQARMDVLDGRLENAIERLTRMIEREPYDISIRYELVQALRERGHERDAQMHLEVMQQSRQLHERYAKLAGQAAVRPYDAQVRKELSGICRSMGKLEAASAWERAAASCSRMGNTSPHGNIGQE